MNSFTNIAVNFCNLDPCQREAVVTCIVNRSLQPEGLCDRIAYIFYLIVENGKMYLGCSDWDKAVDALEEKTFKIIPLLLIYILPESSIRATSELGIKGLIRLNKYPTPYIPDFVSSRISIDDLPAIGGKAIEFVLS